MTTAVSHKGALRFIGGWVVLAWILSVHPVQAASGDGSLAGRLSAAGKSLQGIDVTVRNPETGFTRSVKAEADGRYRFPFLPVGKYNLEAGLPNEKPRTIHDVSVALGNTTNVDIALEEVTTLSEIEVTAAAVITAVDVSSTEIATNITREELTRLPVERDPQAVALLAPGIIKGNFGGVSFGGSSEAENTVYVNGLNVTDFYNRIGFSSVPFSFYKEFQVKTGGYSVEFGRTTGGVINAVTRSGTNEFHFGAEANWEPKSLRSKGSDTYRTNGNPFVISSHDESENTSLNLYASGPIIKDKLFFFLMAEPRRSEPTNTNNSGTLINDGKANNTFWGGKLDWQINDKNLLELLAFSDQDDVTTKIYPFDLSSSARGAQQDTQFSKGGGKNWSLTYTGYLAEGLSMKVLYGENKRNASVNSTNGFDCVSVYDNRQVGVGDIGCAVTGTITSRLDTRKAARIDFEWKLKANLVRFGLDREDNTSNHREFYPGPSGLHYSIEDTTPGATLSNGGVVPAGVNAYVRSRNYEVHGTFQTLNNAFYIEDNWSITPNFLVNAGIRDEGFDNKAGDGSSYIKIDHNIAPRFGFSWDIHGDARSKLFGNLGRYFLPVANVINIKEAGPLLDARTYYAFDGFQNFQYNGATYQRPILGAQIGGVDQSQGNGKVPDLRGRVNADMKAVHQDELILGFQTMLNEKWSWGLRATYRKLQHAIDDMEITSNGILCGGQPGYVGFIVGNPGEKNRVFTDTNCNGIPDAYVTIDTSKHGWALYDSNGKYLGERGWEEPKRNYTALEFQIDRAWDKRWELNASYTLAFSKGNAEGPVNSDTNFSDTGRTENFDDPWVNLGGYGYLPNDRRHQIKVRGGYAISEAWQIGGTLNAQSGRPINAFGVGDPYDAKNYLSYYVCVAKCLSPYSPDRVYQLNPRGSAGTLPWTYNVGASVTYLHSWEQLKLRARFAVYNLLNEQRKTSVNETFESDIGVRNPSYGLAASYSAPRYAQVTIAVDF